MSNLRLRLFLLAASAVALLSIAAGTHAQTYPGKRTVDGISPNVGIAHLTHGPPWAILIA